MLSEGQPYPLRATPTAQGVNLALVAPSASAVDLCLFDHTGQHEQQRLRPYAREVVGHYGGQDIFLGHVPGAPAERDTRDSAALALKARVSAPLPPSKVPRPRIAVGERLIYELHVRGQTMLHRGCSSRCAAATPAWPS